MRQFDLIFKSNQIVSLALGLEDLKFLCKHFQEQVRQFDLIFKSNQIVSLALGLEDLKVLKTRTF